MARNAPSHLPQPPPEVCAASAVGPDQPWELSHPRLCPSLHCLQKGLSPRQPGRDSVIIYEVPTGTAGWVFSERVPPGWPSTPPPERHCRAVVFEGLQEPQVFPPALLPLEAACPAPCISRGSGIWVGSWRKMRTWGGEASPRPRRDLPPPSRR